MRRLAVAPPIDPMLARLSRELPLGDVVYESKWDDNGDALTSR